MWGVKNQAKATGPPQGLQCSKAVMAAVIAHAAVLKEKHALGKKKKKIN